MPAWTKELHPRGILSPGIGSVFSQGGAGQPSAVPSWVSYQPRPSLKIHDLSWWEANYI